MQHDMHVVAHDSIGIEPYCKAFRQRQQTLFHPSLAVLVRASAINVLSAKKSPPDTARDAMEETWRFRIDRLKAWVCHGHTLLFAAGRGYQSTGHGLVGR